MLSGKSYPINFVLGAVDKGAASGVKATVSKINAATATLGKTGKFMTTALTLPILAAGGATIKFAVDFENQMADVETVIDSTKENIGEMGDKVLEIGKRVPVGFADMTAALYDVRSAGVSATDQFQVLEKSAMLAVAGKGTTAEAVDLVTSSLNAFGLEGEKAARVYDNIFATVGIGKTTISQLATGFGGVAGTVADNKIELDEYLSAVAAMTTVGQPAAQAHTQLKAVMSGLTRETKESKKLFKSLGATDFKDLIKISGGLVPALDKIKGELKGDSAAILNLVGSTEAMNAVLGLTGGLASKQREALALMRSDAQVLDEAFAKKQNTTAARTQILANKIQANGIKIGQSLTPIYGKLSDMAGTAVDGFEKLDEGTKTNIAAFVALAAVVGPTLWVLSVGVTVFKALRIWMILTKIATFAWRGAMFALRTAVLAVKAVVALTVGVTRLMTGAMISSTVATKASIAPSYAAAGGFTAMLAPIAAVALAIGALYLAWDRYNKLDKDLEGSGGVTGTVGKMWEMGTFDPFKAHDAVMNEKAMAAAQDRDAKGAVPKLDAAKAAGGKTDKSEVKVSVDFSNMPPGVMAEVEKLKGQAELDVSQGMAAL